MYSAHPAADAFPKMAQDNLEELAKDIAAVGLIYPIVLYENQILDGRNRYDACKIAGVSPKFTTFTGNPWTYAWSANGQRRDLVDEQRALIYLCCDEGARKWAEAKEAVATEANRKRAEAAREQENRGNRYTKKVEVEPHVEAPPLPKRDHSDKTNKASTVKAKAAGVSRSTIERAGTILRTRPDLAEQIKNGDIKPAAAHRLAKKDAVKDKVAALPEGKYRVIYADPPWSYNDKQAVGEFGTGTGAAEVHYPSMAVAEIRALPIQSISHDDAVLFLWATSPLLPDGLAVMSAWGFKYKAAFIWDKVKHNMGHYNSVRHEFLLIGTRGSCTPDANILIDSVQSIERTTHSTKPEDFRAIIDKLYTLGARVELFARAELPSPWVAWGNEANLNG